MTTTALKPWPNGMPRRRQRAIAERYMKEEFMRRYVDAESKELLWDELPVTGPVFGFLQMFQSIWQEYELEDDLGEFLRLVGGETLDLAWDSAMVTDSGCVY